MREGPDGVVKHLVNDEEYGKGPGSESSEVKLGVEYDQMGDPKKIEAARLKAAKEPRLKEAELP